VNLYVTEVAKAPDVRETRAKPPGNAVE